MRKGRDTDPDIDGDLAAMRRYARSLARDDQDADDVVQDALLRAIERRDTFRAEGNRRGWLLAIVHNVFVSGTRRRAAEARRNDRFADTLATQTDAALMMIFWLFSVSAVGPTASRRSTSAGSYLRKYSEPPIVNAANSAQ